MIDLDAIVEDALGEIDASRALHAVGDGFIAVPSNDALALVAAVQAAQAMRQVLKCGVPRMADMVAYERALEPFEEPGK